MGVNHVVSSDYCFQGGDEAGEADDEAEEVEIQNREFSVLNSFTYCFHLTKVIYFSMDKSGPRFPVLSLHNSLA